MEGRQREHTTASLAYVEQLEKLFARALPLKEGSKNELAPSALCLSNEARTTWIKFSDDIEKRLAPGCDLEPISGFAAKLPEHAARIAGVLTKFHNPDAQVVSKAMLGNGIAISLHDATTALRLHGASRIKVEILDAQLLLEWIRENTTRA